MSSSQHRCWAEVDLDALRQNLAWIRHAAGPDTRIVTVAKADAYGHGLKQIAALLMQSGTDVFGVANLVEARAIRSVGRGWPILMLGACLPYEIETAIRDGVMATVSSLEEARAFSAAATKLRRSAKLQLKIDTGMGRLGASTSSIVDLAPRISSLANIELVGIWTHFHSVETDPAATAAQRRAFEGAVTASRESGLAFEFIHAGNSGALLWEPAGSCNAVRPGLLVYGVLPPGSRRSPSDLKSHLRPAMSLKCRVSHIRTIAKGASISYGHTFTAPRRMKIANLSAGYGDGYPCAASNRAKVLIHGRLCRVIGRVTMDQTLVDVSRVPRAATGDEAVLFGKQGERRIDASELANWCDTIPGEILTRVTGRVPRVYLGGHAE